MQLGMKSVPMNEARARGAILGFDGPTRFLSNFALSPVTAYGITFPTVEHAFAAAKIDPADPRRDRTAALEEMRQIAVAPGPNAAKRMGRRTLMRPDWDQVKAEMITELVRRKFADPDLRARLLATGDAELFELNTWGDRIWGVVEENGVMHGRNWLGEILMLVRAEIRNGPISLEGEEN